MTFKLHIIWYAVNTEKALAEKKVTGKNYSSVIIWKYVFIWWKYFQNIQTTTFP